MGETRGGPLITIDGPAGAGKSTVARLLAKRLDFSLLDTGSLYRALALHLIRMGFTPADACIPPGALDAMRLRVEPEVAFMRVFLAGEEVTRLIRDDQVAIAASGFSAKPEVRQALLRIQRSVGEKGNVVAEGRDMGTVVFPDATVKFFLTAGLEERSRRRYRELVERGDDSDLLTVRSEMRARDRRDQTRCEAPLVRAPDAIEIDSTTLDADEVLETMLEHVTRRLNRAAGLGDPSA